MNGIFLWPCACLFPFLDVNSSSSFYHLWQQIPPYNKSLHATDPSIQQIPPCNKSLHATNPSMLQIPPYNKSLHATDPTTRNHISIIKILFLVLSSLILLSLSPDHCSQHYFILFFLLLPHYHFIMIKVIWILVWILSTYFQYWFSYFIFNAFFSYSFKWIMC